MKKKHLMFDTENNYLYIKPNECVHHCINKKCVECLTLEDCHIIYSE